MSYTKKMINGILTQKRTCSNCGIICDKWNRNEACDKWTYNRDSITEMLLILMDLAEKIEGDK